MSVGFHDIIIEYKEESIPFLLVKIKLDTVTRIHLELSGFHLTGHFRPR